MQSAGGSGAGPSNASAPIVNVQEYSIRVPKNLKKNHHVMRFNATLNVDFAQWKNVKMERENNMREYRGFDEDMPKFGAGSEYNRDLREEVRRKKFGITARKYKPDAQPWILKVGGKSGKKFRGIREGGVGENAAFYVFTHAPDGAIEAYPLNEWYNFQPIHRYKALSAEEAEHEFGRRNRVMNYFSLMMRKRLKGDDDDGEDPEEAKLKLAGGSKKGTELKISDMDEWMESDEESESSNDEDAEKSKKNKGDDSDEEKAKKKIKNQPEKKKKRDVDDEAFEESDDGDEEGRERDYDSDSSEPESDPESKANKEMKSVAEEDALRKLLTSDEDSDEEKQSSDESDKEEEKNSKKEPPASSSIPNKKSVLLKQRNKTGPGNSADSMNRVKKKLSKKSKDDKKESLSDFSSDSSDSDADTKPLFKNKKLNGNSANNSRSASPSLSNIDGDSSMGAGSMAMKRKMASMPTDLGSGGNSNGGSENSNSPTVTPAKKPKYDTPSVPSTFAGVISSKE